MMKLMYNSNEGGFHNFQDEEVEDAIANGWVDGEPVRKKMLDAKRAPQPVAKPEEVATMPVQSEPRRAGRPRKEEPSILNNGEI